MVLTIDEGRKVLVQCYNIGEQKFRNVKTSIIEVAVTWKERCCSWKPLDCFRDELELKPIHAEIVIRLNNYFGNVRTVTERKTNNKIRTIVLNNIILSRTLKVLIHRGSGCFIHFWCPTFHSLRPLWNGLQHFQEIFSSPKMYGSSREI